MLEYDKINIDEGIDADKNELISKECIICRYWYFVNKKFNYQRYLSNGCHDMSLRATSMHHFSNRI